MEEENQTNIRRTDADKMEEDSFASHCKILKLGLPVSEMHFFSRLVLSAEFLKKKISYPSFRNKNYISHYGMHTNPPEILPPPSIYPFPCDGNTLDILLKYIKLLELVQPMFSFFLFQYIINLA